MTSSRHHHPEARRFSCRLWIALVLLTGAATALTVWLGRLQLLANETEAVRLRFATESGARRALRDWRIHQLQDQVRDLATRPRLHAALEDDALDLLPQVARDELRDLITQSPAPGAPPASFYRFLDTQARLLPAPADGAAGELPPALTTHFDAYATASGPSWGLWINPTSATAWELVATPFHSTNDGHRLGTLVVGFPYTAGPDLAIWSDGHLHAPGLPPALRDALAATLRSTPPRPDQATSTVPLAGERYLLAPQRIDPGNAVTDSWDLNLASLAPLRARQQQLTWRIALFGLGLAALLAAASGWLSARFAAWFGRVARNLEAQRLRRQLAERRLSRTAEERDRAARFAGDASHQLKTPVAILRLGLDELTVDPTFPPALKPDVAELIEQTTHLSHIIDDLLLLTRLDAGLVPTSSHETVIDDLIDHALDDASAYPGAETRTFTREGATGIAGRGDPRHLGLIFQNLLENALKYGRDDTEVRINVLPDRDDWLIHVTSVSQIPISADHAERIFERFHRGPSSGGKPGHGLGLDLARQLARLHGGELRLLHSDTERTTFELRLRNAA